MTVWISEFDQQFDYKHIQQTAFNLVIGHASKELEMFIAENYKVDDKILTNSIFIITHQNTVFTFVQ